MKALIVTEHGPLEKLSLGEFPDPKPGKGEVLVDVHAASVNFPDLLVIGGTYQNLPPRPFVPGKDLAGVVAAVGEGVTRVKPGDRVLAQIEHRLSEAGSSKAHLLRVQIFLADIKDIAAMNEVWDAWVTPGTAPPRATVQAALSDPDYRIEVVATAVQVALA